MSENEQPKPEPVMRYRGDGTLRIPGVPRRDLTKADVERLQPDALREAMASPLYEIVSGAHLPINRSAVEDAPTEPEGDVVVVPEITPDPQPVTDDPGVQPDGSGESGRSKRRNAGDGE